MIVGKIEQAEGMLCRVGQDPQTDRSATALPSRSLAEREIPYVMFDGDSQSGKENDADLAHRGPPFEKRTSRTWRGALESWTATEM